MPGIPPPTGGGVQDGAWADRWIVDLESALPEAPRHERAATTARLVAVLLASARDERATSLLASSLSEAARRGDPVELSRLELAVALSALARDDDETCRDLLAGVEARGGMPPDVASRAWLVASGLARRCGLPAPPAPGASKSPLEGSADPDERSDLLAELALAHAIQARESGDLSRARLLLAHAQDAADHADTPVHAAAFQLEAACYASAAGDLDQAKERFRTAIDRLHGARLVRLEGRAMIRFAELLATSQPAGQGEAAAAWLGRAQQVLGGAATWRDRLALRTGFRAFGRRVFDRVMSDATVARIERFERARGSLVNALARASLGTDRAVTALEIGIERGTAPGDLSPSVERVRGAARDHAARAVAAIGDLDESMRDLVDVIGVALFERDRLKVLLGVLAEIDQIGSEAELAPRVAAVALPLLEADRVVVAVDHGGILRADGEAGVAAPGTADDWRSLVPDPDRPTRERPSSSPLRSEDGLCGPQLAIPVRGREARGLLYADKLRRKGQFREQDQAIAFLLAEYVALAIGRLQARAEERFAHHRLAVTLDTLRDGVLACDANGVIVSLNAAAARMLGVQPDEVRGARLDAFPALRPLAELLAQSARQDGAIVRLDRGSFVVTARAMSTGDDHDRGLVATLVELDRAQKIAQRLSATRARYSFNDVAGKSPSLLAAVAMGRRAATTDANVLLTGESGTGKEVLAQAIHTAGARAAEPFIGVNVAALPRELLEAELFGYEKGAFTGARVEGNPGKFELAGAGTILLDEIGDMPLDMQAKLLRVLQERVVTRLGGRSELTVHARVIATTHRDLALLVDEGRFRMDLLYRLRVLAIELPPLRDRPEDIAQLAHHFLHRFAEQQRKRVRQLGPRLLDELGRYDWPGNVRELANVMEAEVSLAPPDLDVLERLATRLAGRFRTAGSTSTGEWRVPSTATTLEAPIVPLAEVEKRAILHAIERSGGSVSRAAEALGLSKVTVYAKLRAWGMHPRDRNEESGEGPTSARWTLPRIPAVDEGTPTSKRSPK